MKSVVLNGWPRKKKHCTVEVRPYYEFREDIVYIEGLFFMSDRVIAPETLRDEIVKKVHTAHLGVVKCEERARDIVF